MNLCDHDDEVSSSSDSILWTGLDEDDEDDVDDQDGQDDQVSRGLVVSTGLRTAAPPLPKMHNFAAMDRQMAPKVRHMAAK